MHASQEPPMKDGTFITTGVKIEVNSEDTFSLPKRPKGRRKPSNRIKARFFLLLDVWSALILLREAGKTRTFQGVSRRFTRSRELRVRNSLVHGRSAMARRHFRWMLLKDWRRMRMIVVMRLGTRRSTYCVPLIGISCISNILQAAGGGEDQRAQQNGHCPGNLRRSLTSK